MERLPGFRDFYPEPIPNPEVWSAGAPGEKIGVVTSGTQSPSMGLGIGMGYLPPAYAKKETPIAVSVRGRQVEAVVTGRPIYRKTP